MFRKIQTSRFFNLGTQRALYERVEGYVVKEERTAHKADLLKKEQSSTPIVRLDLGQNPDGCDPALIEHIEKQLSSPDAMGYIQNYPDLNWLPLRERIGALHGVPAKWVLLSAGLDQLLSMISASFFEMNDRFLMNSPSFFLFDEYSRRMGAIPVTIDLRAEDNFDWTESTLDDFRSAVDKLHPKLVWIANPNNPTGRVIPPDMLEEIIRIAAEYYVFVVVDEAYGEYTDPSGGVLSSSKLLPAYHNLIVLRTFSKAYGLASLRVAYALTCESEIAGALNLHRPYYPITGLSYEMACRALDRIDYLDTVRARAAERRQNLQSRLADLEQIRWIESATGTMMVGHKGMRAHELKHRLEAQGIFVASVPGDGVAAQHYVRITIGRAEENEYLIQVLESFV